MATAAQDVAMLLNDAAHQRSRGRFIQALNSVRLARAIRLDTSLKASCEQLRNIISRNAARIALLQSTLMVKMVRVAVWPDGYANGLGPQSFVIPQACNPDNEAARRFGPMAKVFSVRPYQQTVSAIITNAQALAYTQRDNS